MSAQRRLRQKIHSSKMGASGSSNARARNRGSQNREPYDVRSCVYDDSFGDHYYDVQIVSTRPRFFNAQGLDLRSKLLEAGHRRMLRHTWKFYYVITLLYLHRWNKVSETDEYRPLNCRMLRQILGSRFATPVLKILRELRVIECDEGRNYLPGSHSRGYRLCEPYRAANFHKIHPPIPKAAARAVERMDCLRIRTDGSRQQDFLLQNLQKVTLDDPVYDCMERHHFKTVRQRDYYLRSVEFLATQYWFFSHDRRTGRVFNNVTSFPKLIRPFLRVDGMSLVEIDVANCQPFLLLQLCDDAEERTRFAALVCSGLFYEKLDELLPIPYGHKRRTELKEAVFRDLLFDKLRPRTPDLCRAFKRVFPSLYQEIVDLKHSGYEKVALVLQKAEADLIIGNVVRRIAQTEQFPVLTIHDSILTLPQHQSIVERMMQDAFVERFGCSPTFRVTNLGAESEG